MQEDLTQPLVHSRLKYLHSLRISYLWLLKLQEKPDCIHSNTDKEKEGKQLLPGFLRSKPEQKPYYEI